MTRIVATDHPQCLALAATTLRRGGLVIYPTDTVYGLGALASNDDAVNRLFAAKGRSPEKPLPLLLADAEQLDIVAKLTSSAACTLKDHFWPGALTIILPKSPTFNSLALAGKPNIAVRVPNHPLLRAIIRHINEPITGTSANLSGTASPLTATQATQQLGNQIELAIDDGATKAGKESTVVDITTGVPALIREGAISRADIEAVLGQPIFPSLHKVDQKISID